MPALLTLMPPHLMQTLCSHASAEQPRQGDELLLSFMLAMDPCTVLGHLAGWIMGSWNHPASFNEQSEKAKHCMV